MKKKGTQPPTLPEPLVPLLLLALVVATGVTGARAVEKPSITDGPDPVVTVTCDSAGEVEASSATHKPIDGIDDLVEDCERGLQDAAALRVVDVDLDDVQPAGACATTTECQQHCDGKCAFHNGRRNAALVQDYASTATGNACSCKCGDQSTVYTICISQRPR